MGQPPSSVPPRCLRTTVNSQQLPLFPRCHSWCVDALTRYDRWMRQVMEGSLGTWAEYWRDLSNTAQYAAWHQLAQARGANSDLQYHMTRSLLPEVIYAAGGVERELGQLRTAVADVQRFADEASAQRPRDPGDWPECGWHVSTPSMREASYIFTNLLSWARSTVDRTRRRDRGGGSQLDCYLPWHLARSMTAWRPHCGISRPRFPRLDLLRSASIEALWPHRPGFRDSAHGAFV
jgi:hypothetical protein